MNDYTVFERSTGEPCQTCLRLYRRGEIRRESVMPLPKWGPTIRDTGEKCCFDCQAAETLLAVGHIDIPFHMARLTVANDRAESLRQPKGMAQLMGLCQMGLMKPASINDLSAHLDWVEANVPLVDWADDEE